MWTYHGAGEHPTKWQEGAIDALHCTIEILFSIFGIDLL